MELWLHQVPAHLQDTLGSAFQRRGVLQDVFKAEQMLLDYAESLAREIAAGRDEQLSLILLQWPPSRTCTFPQVLPFCKSLQTRALPSMLSPNLHRHRGPLFSAVQLSVCAAVLLCLLCFGTAFWKAPPVWQVPNECGAQCPA